MLNGETRGTNLTQTSFTTPGSASTEATPALAKAADWIANIGV